VIGIIFGYYFANQTEFSPKPIQSVSNFYLDESRIFVVSANASYGNYPYPTVTSPPFGNPSGSPIAENGEPCVIINVTLRNDYSTEYPAPNPIPHDTTLVYVAFTAHIFTGEKQINAKDITNADWVFSAGTNGAFTSLHYGESTTVTIYLATNNRDVTSFQLFTRYVGELVPP
jgi:hypothetical protein